MFVNHKQNDKRMRNEIPTGFFYRYIDKDY